MANETYFEKKKKWVFTCAGCWKSESGFDDKKQAELALQLHKIGCKKC